MGQLLPNVFNGIFPPMKFLFLEMVLSGSLRLVVKQEVPCKHAECMYVHTIGVAMGRWVQGSRQDPLTVM